MSSSSSSSSSITTVPPFSSSSSGVAVAASAPSGYRTLTGQLSEACVKAERKLDEIEHKVDAAIMEAAGGGSLLPASEKTSELLKSLQEIREEYRGLTDEIAELKSEQESSMCAIFAQLQAARGHILKMEKDLGAVPLRINQGEQKEEEEEGKKL